MKKIHEQDFILKTFQLRAARAVANIKLQEIGNALGLTKAAISKWEHKSNFASLKTSHENILILKKMFEKYNIFFPDINSIALNEFIGEQKPEGLTRFQLKAARAILNISQEQLAQYLSLSKQTIRRAELPKKNRYIRPSNPETPAMLKNFFGSKNIIFKDNNTISFY